MVQGLFCYCLYDILGGNECRRLPLTEGWCESHVKY